MAEFYINISKHRKKFKDSMGQANHFLITALIGLDYIYNNDDVSCPESFSTSWNPIDKKQSIDRTRQYILKSSLAWAIDCLDSYMSMCNQEPRIIQDGNLISDFDNAGKSVNKKFRALSRYIHSTYDFDIYMSMVGLAIQWRNNTIHSAGENKIEDEHRKILSNSAERIKELFCNLDINTTLCRFDSRQNPTFKEVTSIVRSVQKFVEFVDLYLISKMNITEYACSILNYHCKNYSISPQIIKTLPEEKRDSKIRTILKNNSFSETSTINNAVGTEINDIIESWAKQ